MPDQTAQKRSLGREIAGSGAALSVNEARQIARVLSWIGAAFFGATALWLSSKYGRRFLNRVRTAPILNRGAGDIDVAPAP